MIPAATTEQRRREEKNFSFPRLNQYNFSHLFTYFYNQSAQVSQNERL